MAKKREFTEAQTAMLIDNILYDFEHRLHLPAEFVQAMGEELKVHPEKLGLGFENEDDGLRALYKLMTEVGEKLYGKAWKEDFIQSIIGADESADEWVEGADENAEDSMEMADEDTEATGKRTGSTLFLPADNIQKCTIRISLRNVKPTVWRKLEVPSNITLSYLAEILLYVMGWEGYHLHQFRKNGVYYKQVTDEDTFWLGGDRLMDESEYTLGQVLTKKGDKMVLEYDFGDGWEHQVSLSKIEPYADEEPPFPHLLSGKNACPPEDCGGVLGYEALCNYYYTGKKDPNFPKEHYALVDKDFNPEYFPLEELRKDIEDVDK